MVKIIDVKITTYNSWGDINALGSWGSVNRPLCSWQWLTQTTTTGQVIKIEVEAKDPNWNDVLLDYMNWNDIKQSYTTWLNLKDYNERM